MIQEPKILLKSEKKIDLKTEKKEWAPWRTERSFSVKNACFVCCYSV